MSCDFANVAKNGYSSVASVYNQSSTVSNRLSENHLFHLALTFLEAETFLTCLTLRLLKATQSQVGTEVYNNKSSTAHKKQHIHIRLKVVWSALTVKVSESRDLGQVVSVRQILHKDGTLMFVLQVCCSPVLILVCFPFFAYLCSWYA